MLLVSSNWGQWPDTLRFESYQLAKEAVWLLQLPSASLLALDCLPGSPDLAILLVQIVISLHTLLLFTGREERRKGENKGRMKEGNRIILIGPMALLKPAARGPSAPQPLTATQ